MLYHNEKPTCEFLHLKSFKSTNHTLWGMLGAVKELLNKQSVKVNPVNENTMFSKLFWLWICSERPPDGTTTIFFFQSEEHLLSFMECQSRFYKSFSFLHVSLRTSHSCSHSWLITERHAAAPPFSLFYL